jgi:hypothetical protein
MRSDSITSATLARTHSDVSEAKFPISVGIDPANCSMFISFLTIVSYTEDETDQVT